MPMIDVYATAGTFPDSHGLARVLARTVMEIEQVPDIPLFRQNTAAFVHDLPSGALSNVDGEGDHVRVQVLTNAEAAGDPSLVERTWVLLTEAPEGGWGIAGHANTNTELVGLARAQLGKG